MKPFLIDEDPSYAAAMENATLKQLRSLAATIDAGTIVGAARRLHVTAPAIGQQLRLLERTIGLPLFDRTPEGLRTTDAGRELLATVSRIEAELEGCRRNLDLIRDGKVGSVALGAVSTAKYFAPQILAAFWAGNPSVDVKLFISNRDETIQGLAQNDFDLVIMGRPPRDLDLESIVIGDHPHVIVAPPSHHLAHRRRIPQRVLGAERFLIREMGSGTRQLTDRLLADAAIQPTIGMEITSNETIKQAVIADLGIALISAHTVAAEIKDGRLIHLDVIGLPVMRQWYAVHRSSLRLGPAGRALWAFLGERAREFLPSVDLNLSAGR